LMSQSPRADAASTIQAHLHFYDQLGGGIESSFGQDKSGLGITKRHKKRGDRSTPAAAAGDPGP
jgi:hypothetical protein